MVLQDVVIYPRETPPSLGGPSRSSAGESTAGRMGRAGGGRGKTQPRTQDSGDRRGNRSSVGEGRKKRRARVRNNRQEAREVEKDQV